MSVGPELIRHLAQLAKIRLRPQECDELSAQIDRIVGYICQLQQVDVEGIAPTQRVVAEGTAGRDDEPRTSLPRERVLALSAEHDEGCFVLPRVVSPSEDE